jgi:CDP-4-dehydro-6-deoxyglucose reductase
VLTCCAVPQTDIVLESRQVTDESAFPVRKMPSRVTSLEKVSHDVMIVKLQLPGQRHAALPRGQYVEFILRDGARRSYSMAKRPHNGPGVELHIRHMPGGKFTDHVFTAMKEKEILRVEGPVRQLLPARGLGQADDPAGLRHRLRADQGADRIHAVQGHPAPGHPVLGRAPSVDLYMEAWVRDRLAWTCRS